LLERHPRRRGAAKIRAVLAANRIGATVTRSELEERFLRFLSRNRLPGPELNVPLAVHRGFVEADCVWRAQRLIVELDGQASHTTTAAFERDRARDRVLHVAGWTVVRITWRQLDREGRELARDLRALLDA
jgi:very-short-patch-repair endonuclease